ncbi:MAG: potassium-transporting ATPase subunit C [Actinobacteria bacterium]|nr:potassium-transporting ATPase subunit C [Actinomycetota bacterium]
MRRDILTSILAVLAMTVVFGVAYPLLVTGAAQVAFPERANGSLVHRGGRVVGSRLIGQDFRVQASGKNGRLLVDPGKRPVMWPVPRYFQERPSTQTSYDADATAFTNLGPNSKDARDSFRSNLRSYLSLERPYDRGLTAAEVPIDAVTSSASGIDPQISQANARIQAHRVAALRHLPLSTVDALIRRHTDGRFAGVFGEPGVNVLELNLELDRLRE